MYVELFWWRYWCAPTSSGSTHLVRYWALRSLPSIYIVVAYSVVLYTAMTGVLAVTYLGLFLPFQLCVRLSTHFFARFTTYLLRKIFPFRSFLKRGRCSGLRGRQLPSRHPRREHWKEPGKRARESTPAVSTMKNERSAICTSGITTVEWERWIWVGQESGRFQRAAIAGWRSDDSVYHPDRQFLWDRLRRFTARWVAHTDPPVVRMKVWRKNTPRATQRESVAKAKSWFEPLCHRGTCPFSPRDSTDNDRRFI